MINNTDDASPSYIVRNEIVADKLNEMGHEIDCRVSGASLEIDDYDVFLFNRFYEGSLIREISALKQMGKTIIYETDDDYESINESHPFHKIKSYGVLSSRELIKLADGIIVSTHELKERIEPMAQGKPVMVVPNTLDFTQYKKRKGGNEKLRIGFQGSHVHITDLLMVIEAVAQLQKEHDFEFHILGIDDRPLSELYQFCLTYKEKYQWVTDFLKLYKALKGMRYIHHKSVPYDEYRAKLSEINLDIGICPLTDNAFNSAKSCLKFYEYAAVGTVTLASDVIPYNQEMDSQDLVKNRHIKWYNKLKTLIVDEEYRKRRLEAQAIWVNNERNIEKMKLIWEDVFNIIINHKQNDEKSIDNSQRNLGLQQSRDVLR